jgi:tryptophan 2,3-dioxygenase
MTKSAPPGLESGIRTNLDGEHTYGRYLELDQLLGCQHPVSDSHDELLFIVIHQATELWLKLMVHELRAARRHVATDRLGPALKMLARVSRIQAQLIQSWDVLSTLTPADYLAFRDRLGPASGLQSHQFRLLEYVLGHKQPAALALHRHTPEIHAELARELAMPSLYDETIRLLGRRGQALPPACLERDWRQPHRSHPAILAAWQLVYTESAVHWDLYELAEQLVDLEDWFRQWRFRHMTTVERIIGRRPGTGGSSGVDHLRRTLDVALFPELWEVRTEL